MKIYIFETTGVGLVVRVVAYSEDEAWNILIDRYPGSRDAGWNLVESKLLEVGILD